MGLKVLSNHRVGFPGSQPPPLDGSQKSPSLELYLQLKVKGPNVTFLPLSIRKFQGFWKLWARNCEWRPNVYHYVCIWPLCMYVIYVAGKGGSKRTLSRGPQFSVRTRRRIWGLTHGKTSLLSKEQKEHLKGEEGQAKRGTGPEVVRYWVFQGRAFTYSSTWVWIDSFDWQLQVT